MINYTLDDENSNYYNSKCISHKSENTELDKVFREEKKLCYIDGIGEGIFEYQIEKLGSYQNKTFNKIILSKYNQYDNQDLVDYFEFEYIYDSELNQIEITCKYTFEPILYSQDQNITLRIIYCEYVNNNIHDEIHSCEQNGLPYIKSSNSLIDLCIPKFFDCIGLKKFNYLIRKKQVFIF